MNIRGNNFFLASGGQLVTDRFGMSSAVAMGMSYDQKGLTYQVREEWRLSGPNGWNTDLYPAG